MTMSLDADRPSICGTNLPCPNLFRPRYTQRQSNPIGYSIIPPTRCWGSRLRTWRAALRCGRLSFPCGVGADAVRLCHSRENMEAPGFMPRVIAVAQPSRVSVLCRRYPVSTRQIFRPIGGRSIILHRSKEGKIG
jgi:hypothetical protein